MEKGKIIILSGPSGSGKTTLFKEVLKAGEINKKLKKTISVTTRSKRKGEKEGKDYYFISKRMFLYKKKTNQFLESQKVFDNYYGTPKKQVEDFLKKGRSVLLCIDVKGAKVVFKKFSQAKGIFIKTSSYDVLKKRLLTRGSEDKKVMSLRLKIACQELKEAKNYQYIVVNDSLSKAIKELKRIIRQILEIK